ncbi:MAG TPA: PilZ domain-containing protein [Candidatus Dormibacteraeota bacterium]|nr:PilZ domain-containing protein [Candidatus Dormibacteraeota bacterium]
MSSNLARTVTSTRNRHFSPWNVFSALLLLPEEASLSMARRVMESFGIGVFAASSLLEAEKILHNTRLDLALCDFEVPLVGDLSLLQVSSRWRGLCIGLMPAARPDQSGLKRVQISVPKPMSVDMLVRSLKASYTNIAQQRIAAYRHTLPVKLISGTLAHRGWQRTLHQVSVLNVSQTGLCLNALEPLPHGASVTLSLGLPETSFSLHASGNVVWSHNSGRAGIAFERSDCPEMKKLQERLNAWLPRELGMVARTA